MARTTEEAANVARVTIAGRSEELARFETARAAVAEGRPRILIVAGEAGIGKTRLVAEASEAARAAGWRVLAGACLDIVDGGPAYMPISEILRRLAQESSPEDLELLLGPGRMELAIIAPELAEGDATDVAGSATPADPSAPPAGLSQGRLFERLLQLLARLGASAPTLIVVEDVQWLDRATRDVLTFLARNLTVERILIALTCRTDAAPRGDPILTWLAELGRSASVERLDLRPLDRAAVAAQLEAIAGSPPSAATVDAIWRRSNGNPLFVEELSSAAEHGDETGRPPTLDEMLLGRIGTLPPTGRQVIDALAVAARPVDAELLAEVVGLSLPDVSSALREGLAHGVVSIVEPDGRCQFRHELLREAVVGQLLASERRSLHERFATALAANGGTPSDDPPIAAAELAYHWLGAGRVGHAFVASVAAATEAEQVYAHADAHHHFERAIELQAKLPEGDRPAPEDSLALLRRASDAADLAGDFDRALVLTRQALASIDPATDAATAGLLHSRLGYLLWAAGQGDALEEHRTAVSLVPADRPTPERARVLARLAGALMGGGRWSECRNVATMAVDCAVGAGDLIEESLARNILGSVLVALGRIDDGVSELRRAREIAAQIGTPDTLIIAHHNLALNLLQADHFEEALAEAEAGLEAARRTGLERRFGLDLVALIAETLLRLGRWDEADGITLAGLALDPLGVGTTYLATVRARVAALRGDSGEALTRLAAIDAADLDADVAAELATVRAEVAILAGRQADALAAVAGGLLALEGLDDVLWTAPLVAFGLRAAGDAVEIARARETGGRPVPVAASEANRTPDPDVVPDLETRLAYLVGRSVTATTAAWIATAGAERSRISGVPDPSSWAAAATAWDAVPDPYRSAEARYRLAEAELRIRGIRADVASLLRGAHATAISVGAIPLQTAVEGLARRARVPLMAGDGIAASPASPASGDDAATIAGIAATPAMGLSTREVEVLGLIAAGLSNGEIAARLFITRKTASVHVTHILDKLGVANRVEAAILAERAGLKG